MIGVMKMMASVAAEFIKLIVVFVNPRELRYGVTKGVIVLIVRLKNPPTINVGISFLKFVIGSL